MGHGLVAAIDADLGRAVSALELFPGLDTEPQTRHDERSEPLARHVPTLFVEPVVVRHDAAHDDVRALQVEENVAGCAVTHDDAHAFALGREWEHLEDVVHERAEVAGQRDRVLVACCEMHAHRARPVDERDFVGTRCLVRHAAVLVRDGRHVVAQGQRHDHVVHLGTHIAPGACAPHVSAHGVMKLAPHFVHAVPAIAHGAEVQSLELHLVLGEGAGLVAQQVLDAPELLWQC